MGPNHAASIFSRSNGDPAQIGNVIILSFYLVCHYTTYAIAPLRWT